MEPKVEPILGAFGVGTAGLVIAATPRRGSFAVLPCALGLGLLRKLLDLAKVLQEQAAAVAHESHDVQELGELDGLGAVLVGGLEDVLALVVCGCVCASE
jgi:hypothetical protein